MTSIREALGDWLIGLVAIGESEVGQRRSDAEDWLGGGGCGALGVGVGSGRGLGGKRAVCLRAFEPHEGGSGGGGGGGVLLRVGVGSGA